MTGTKNCRILVGALIILLTLTLFPLIPVHAEGGIAISGSFYRHHFKMVPGESIASPHINVVIFNNYANDIQVKIVPDTPEGVHIELEEEIITLAANSSLTVPIKLRVEDIVVPGDYTIGIYAEVIPQPGEGIIITGSAEMRSKLTVYGEAARVNIKTVTIDGEPFRGTLHLFHKLENELEPAGFSDTGELAERVIPGTYFVQAYWEGTEVAQQEFTLAVDEEKEIILEVQTVFLTGFGVIPQYAENSEKIVSAKLSYSIKNIYEPLENVKTMLSVYYKGELLEQIEMYAVPTLPVGNKDNRYSYIPPRGWESGEYSFKIGLYSGDKLYTETGMKDLTVKIAFPTKILLYGCGGALLLLIIFFIIYKRRKCKKCKGTGYVLCHYCNGHGYTGTEENKCMLCNGTGKLKCRSCKGTGRG